MAKKSYTFLKDKKKNKFLNYFVTLGTISKAANEMDISRQTHYDWLNNDDQYAAAFQKAQEMAADLLEEEAFRRATGYEVPVYHQGVEVGKRVMYSDFLLKFLLQGAKPEKYKERVQNENIDMGAARLGWEDDTDAREEENNDSLQAGEAVEIYDTSEPGKS